MFTPLKNDQVVPYPTPVMGPWFNIPELFVSHVSLFLKGNK